MPQMTGPGLRALAPFARPPDRRPADPFGRRAHRRGIGRHHDRRSAARQKPAPCSTAAGRRTRAGRRSSTSIGATRAATQATTSAACTSARRTDSSARSHGAATGSTTSSCRCETSTEHIEAAAASVAKLLQGPRTTCCSPRTTRRCASAPARSSASACSRLPMDRCGCRRCGRSPTSTCPDDRVPLSGDVADRWGWLAPNREWRNLASSPRFDANAELAAQMWKASTGQDVDGVLAHRPRRAPRAARRDRAGRGRRHHDRRRQRPRGRHADAVRAAAPGTTKPSGASTSAWWRPLSCDVSKTVIGIRERARVAARRRRRRTSPDALVARCRPSRPDGTRSTSRAASARTRCCSGSTTGREQARSVPRRQRDGTTTRARRRHPCRHRSADAQHVTDRAAAQGRRALRGRSRRGRRPLPRPGRVPAPGRRTRHTLRGCRTPRGVGSRRREPGHRHLRRARPAGVRDVQLTFIVPESMDELRIEPSARVPGVDWSFRGTMDR